MNKMNLKIGDYLICRYKGESGDLIAGRVTRIHRDGTITSANLLSKGDSTRHIDVLHRRNLVVPRSVAMEVVHVYEKNEDKQAARAKAVELATAHVAASSSKDFKEPKAAKGSTGGAKRGRKPGRKPGRPRKVDATPTSSVSPTDHQAVVSWLKGALKGLQKQQPGA